MNTVNPDDTTAFGGYDDDNTTRPIPTGQPSAGRVGAGQATPDQPLYAPLPYGTGFSSPQPLGFGVGPADVGLAGSGSAGSGLAGFGSASGTTGSVEVAEQKRSGSPILAVAGVLSMAVAVWAILGAPVITPTVLLAAGLVLTVLVGLVMVIRR